MVSSITTRITTPASSCLSVANHRSTKETEGGNKRRERRKLHIQTRHGLAKYLSPALPLDVLAYAPATLSRALPLIGSRKVFWSMNPIPPGCQSRFADISVWASFSDGFPNRQRADIQLGRWIPPLLLKQVSCVVGLHPANRSSRALYPDWARISRRNKGTQQWSRLSTQFRPHGSEPHRPNDLLSHTSRV